VAPPEAAPTGETGTDGSEAVAHNDTGDHVIAEHVIDLTERDETESQR
jgi:hypothetical protein